MQALTQWLDRGFRVLLVGLMAGMVASVCWQVISRYALNDPAAWTEEMARFLLMWIGLLGACYAYREGQHLGVDLFPKSLSPARYRLWALCAHSLVILFSVMVLLIGGGRLVYLTASLNQTSAALGVPMSWIYMSLPLCGVMMIVYALDAMLHPEQPSTEGVMNDG